MVNNAITMAASALSFYGVCQKSGYYKAKLFVNEFKEHTVQFLFDTKAINETEDILVMSQLVHG